MIRLVKAALIMSPGPIRDVEDVNVGTCVTDRYNATVFFSRERVGYSSVVKHLLSDQRIPVQIPPSTSLWFKSSAKLIYYYVNLLFGAISSCGADATRLGILTVKCYVNKVQVTMRVHIDITSGWINKLTQKCRD